MSSSRLAGGKHPALKLLVRNSEGLGLQEIQPLEVDDVSLGLGISVAD